MSSRFLIGLDLGTTNSAVAYVDTTEPLRGGRPAIHRFAIRQLVRPGEVDPRDTLPSFLYFPTPDEAPDSRFPIPDSSAEPAIVGTYARDHGALVPGRQVTSAKSWLCNPAVDRDAAILPWGHEEGQPACSPVDASARYLQHLRDAWNDAHATRGDDARFERQAIVLTVPASFDEEARELTLEAARRAGLQSVILLEEPLAAFYAWIASHAASFRRRLHDGDVVLVCDVGGGTTDFTLIKAVVPSEGEIQFERTAVGEHLLLGGDNLDLALAARVERKLGEGARLTLRQRQALARLTSAAKETLLGDGRDDRVRLVIPAAGSALVGGRLAVDLTRDEVVETLRDGFLPAVARDDLPARGTRHLLREFGLPYASDPAITRHLAAFLARTGSRPAAVIFNGGFFSPDIARDAIVRTLESWFGSDESWHLTVLTNRNPVAAVAIGGAYYAFVRHHGGIRVSGGSARAYYIGLVRSPESGVRSRKAGVESPESGVESPESGVESPESGVESPRSGVRSQTSDLGPRTSDLVSAVCVMPRGTDEGTELDLSSRQFTIATNRPVAFPLFSSTVRQDRLGEVVDLDLDDVHEHAPLVTILRYGKKSRQADLPVHLSVRFTEVGTLEIWCHSDLSEHRWRLQFELRATEHAVDEDEPTAPDAAPRADDETGIVVPEDAVQHAAGFIRDVFAPGGSPSASASEGAERATPETLVARIEAVFGFARQAWPLAVIRQLADVLLENAEGRRRSARHEARWLNLAGFCLRPGFGATLDQWRMEQLRRVYLAGHLFPKDIQGEAEWLVLWQRVAGGLSAGQQQEIFQRSRVLVGLGGKKETRRVNPQIEREAWRLLASLELLPASTRASLGNELLARLARQPSNAAFLWSLGRLGARIPSHGPLNTVVAAATAAGWIVELLSRPSPDAQAAIVQMAARTDDPHRDIDESLRAVVVARLAASGAAASDIERVQHYVAPVASDAVRMFGETLPDGLRLADSTS